MRAGFNIANVIEIAKLRLVIINPAIQQFTRTSIYKYFHVLNYAIQRVD